MRHRVILVREWDAQHTGSGCCGRLGGVGNELGDECTFAHNRTEMEAMGELYRSLRTELPGDVELTIADPRNSFWLGPAIFKDARASGMGVAEAVRQVKRGIAYNSIVVDGKVLFAGRIPQHDQGVAAVVSELSVR
jgi:hypothetical protein